MRLIKGGIVVRDPWAYVGDDHAIPEGPAIVSLERWRSQRKTLLARNAPMGVRLRSEHGPEEIAGDTERFGVIALEFPTFKDGRAYSSARLLHERYGYAGELRAVGNVLRDQLLFMVRCGFDSFEVQKDGDADAWAAAMSEIGVFYQPTNDARTTAARLRRLPVVGTWAY